MDLSRLLDALDVLVGMLAVLLGAYAVYGKKENRGSKRDVYKKTWVYAFVHKMQRWIEKASGVVLLLNIYKKTSSFSIC